MEKQNLYIFNFSVFLLKTVIIVAVAGFSFSFAFEKSIIFNSQISGASKVNRILTKTIVDEVPIFGSSRADGSYVPSIIFEKKSHNYGISGGQANIWLFFLEQELKKEKNTPILINFDLGGFNYSDGDIGNYIPNWNDTKDILVEDGEFYFNVPFIKYFGKYESYFKLFINEKFNLTKITDNGGSFEKNKLTKYNFDKLVEKRKNTVSSFTKNNRLLSKFNQLINTTNRTIILVVSPYHSSYFNKFKNINEVDNYLSNLSKKNNIKVIDLRNFIKNDSLFLNTSHLNYDGAVKFSQKLKEELKASKIEL
ncbi:hypothetical protein [Croceibacter atlanticus]|uniref:hypothetical protein n=1 Tax=Croceibacter atlanticus TaxID=313588 RepID=UPI0024BB4E74|nr:hypothetical protein [Croceibacter atlanticus]